MKRKNCNFSLRSSKSPSPLLKKHHILQTSQSKNTSYDSDENVIKNSLFTDSNGKDKLEKINYSVYLLIQSFKKKNVLNPLLEIKSKYIKRKQNKNFHHDCS